MTTPPDLEEKSRLTMTVLDAGLRNDGDTFNTAMDRIADDGWHGLYGASCALAKALLHVCPVPGDFVGLEAVDMRTGRRASIEETGMPADLIAAARIIVAVGNDDYQAAGDVFYAAVDSGYGEHVVGAVAALVISRLLQEPKFRKVYGDRWKS